MNVWNEIVAAEKVIRGTIHNVVKGASQHEMEDIYSNVVLHLATKLESTYDAERGVPVARFIAMSAHSRATEYMRARKWGRNGGRQSSIDATSDSDDSGSTTLSDRLPCTNTIGAFAALAAKQQREELCAAFAELPASMSEFAVDAFLDDMSVEELAVKYAISDKTVYSRKCKIKALLVAALG